MYDWIPALKKKFHLKSFMIFFKQLGEHLKHFSMKNKRIRRVYTPKPIKIEEIMIPELTMKFVVSIPLS